MNTNNGASSSTSSTTAAYILNENDRHIVCSHASSPDLCPHCQFRSYGYWSTYMTLWLTQLPEHLQTVLFLVIDYVLALHDLRDSQIIPPFGVHPHVPLMAKILGIQIDELRAALTGCYYKPAPIMFYQEEKLEPPFIEPQFRAFLTDLRRVQTEENAVHLRDMTDVHNTFSKRYLCRFFNVVERIEQDEELKTYVGLGWFQHVLCSDHPFEDIDLSDLCRGLPMNEWFQWILDEGWKKLNRDMSSVRTEPVLILAEFVNRFLDACDPYSLRPKALDTELKRFFNRHYIRHHDQGDDKSMSRRFISSSWFLNFPTGVDIPYTFPIPNVTLPHNLRLDRHLLMKLLSFYHPPPSDVDEDEWIGEVEEIDEDEDDELEGDFELVARRGRPLRRRETNRGFEIPTQDGIEHHLRLDLKRVLISFKEAVRQEDSMMEVDDDGDTTTHLSKPTWNPDWGRLPDETEMDRIFSCGPLFKVWLNGSRCSPVVRTREETHEDLAICCMRVLVESDVQGKEVNPTVLGYARIMWSYHLSFAQSTPALMQTLEEVTNEIAFYGRISFEDLTFQHTSRVNDWLTRMCDWNKEDFDLKILRRTWETIGCREISS